MIVFTKEEVVELLKHLSRIEGAIMNSNVNCSIWEQFDYPEKLLTDKLITLSSHPTGNEITGSDPI